MTDQFLLSPETKQKKKGCRFERKKTWLRTPQIFFLAGNRDLLLGLDFDDFGTCRVGEFDIGVVITNTSRRDFSLC